MRNFKFYIILAVMFALLLSVSSAILILPKTNVLTESAKVALVNEDEGYTNNMATFDYGDRFITEYSNTSENNVTITSRTDALEQLNAGTYDLIIIVPQYFSRDIMTYDSKNPKTSNIEYYVNPNSSKLDYLSNVLQKENIETDINDMVSASFVKEVMNEVYSLKDSNNLVFEMQTEYSENYEDNVSDPYNEAFNEIVSILGSVESQQNLVATQASAVSSYQSSTDSVKENTVELDENLNTFYTDISEYKALLDSSYTNINTLNTNLTTYEATVLNDKTISGPDSVEKDGLQLAIETLDTNVTKIEQYTKTGTIKTNVLNELNAQLVYYPQVSLSTIKQNLIDAGASLSAEDQQIRNAYLNEVIEVLASHEGQVSGDATKNSTYIQLKSQLESNCRSYSSEAVDTTATLCTQLGATPTGVKLDNKDVISALVQVIFNRDVASTSSAIASVCTEGCSLDNEQVYLMTTTASDLKYDFIDTVNVLLNAIATTSAAYEEVNNLRLLVDTLNTYHEQLVVFEQSVTTFLSTNIGVMEATLTDLVPFYENYSGYGTVTTNLGEEQQQLVSALNDFSDLTASHVESTNNLADSGTKMLETTTASKSVVENNQTKIVDSKKAYDEMLTINEEYVEDFNGKYLGAKNGSIDNEIFYTNFITPTTLVDSGNVFNFGSIIPFLIMLLIIIFALITGYIYKQWSPKVVSKTQHKDVSRYAINLKQLLFVTITGLITSLIITYIGINALSLTASMAVKFAFVTIFVGLAITLLFYMLLSKFKVYGMMVIGIMLILYFVTNGVLDLEINSQIVKYIGYLNPITYFEIVLREIIYGRSINVILFSGVTFVILAASIAIIITSKDILKRTDSENVY